MPIMRPDGFVPHDPSEGTYSNGFNGPPVTVEAILATVREIEALGPPPPRGYVVAPDVVERVRVEPLAPPGFCAPEEAMTGGGPWTALAMSFLFARCEKRDHR